VKRDEASNWGESVSGTVQTVLDVHSPSKNNHYILLYTYKEYFYNHTKTRCPLHRYLLE